MTRFQFLPVAQVQFMKQPVVCTNCTICHLKSTTSYSLNYFRLSFFINIGNHPIHSFSSISKAIKRNELAMQKETENKVNVKLKSNYVNVIRSLSLQSQAPDPRHSFSTGVVNYKIFLSLPQHPWTGVVTSMDYIWHIALCSSF